MPIKIYIIKLDISESFGNVIRVHYVIRNRYNASITISQYITKPLRKYLNEALQKFDIKTGMKLKRMFVGNFVFHPLKLFFSYDFSGLKIGKVCFQ